MTVPKHLKKRWAELSSTGDIQAIATRAGKSYETIRQALLKGECSDHVFATIASFYEEKSKLVKQYL